MSWIHSSRTVPPLIIILNNNKHTHTELIEKNKTKINPETEELWAWIEAQTTIQKAHKSSTSIINNNPTQKKNIHKNLIFLYFETQILYLFLSDSCVAQLGSLNSSWVSTFLMPSSTMWIQFLSLCVCACEISLCFWLLGFGSFLVLW